MSCETYEDALIDHAFGGPAAAALERHLASCPACRARLREERKLAKAIDTELHDGLDIVPAAGFEGAVRRRVATDHRVASSVRRAGMAVALAAAVTVIAIGLRPSPSPAPGPPPVRITNERPLPTLPIVQEAPAPVPQPPPHRVPRPPVAPEVLVPPDQQRALQRLRESRLTGMMTEPPLPFAPVPLTVGLLDELPRLTVVDDLPVIEPPAALDRLATGGDV